MAFFDLKPHESLVLHDASIRNIDWTVSRDKLPPLLEGRVALSQWESTYDAVLSLYEDYSRMVKEQKAKRRHEKRRLSAIPRRFFRSSCVNSKKIAQNTALADDHHAAWLELVTAQGQIYQQYGIHVALTKGLVSYETSSSRLQKSNDKSPSYQQHRRHTQSSSGNAVNFEPVSFEPVGLRFYITTQGSLHQRPHQRSASTATTRSNRRDDSFSSRQQRRDSVTSSRRHQRTRQQRQSTF